MFVIACPGQGAQTPGFLSPWLEVPGFVDQLRWLSAVADLDLLHHGTTSDAETIRDTAVAQPLIVASGLAALSALFPQTPDPFTHVAGHSVGEITAAVGAGVLSAEQAMVLVRERGRAMAAASAVVPTGMTAVVGGDPDEVTAALARHDLTPANVNGAGQVVAAGTLEQLAALDDDGPAKARLVRLQVAGAFHTAHMAPAVTVLDGYPRLSLLSNADGSVVRDGRQVLARLVSQVSNPVRWDLCMQAMGELGVTGFVEIPPAGTLTGLVKRTLPGVECLALKTPDQLAAARELVARHSGSPHPEESRA